MQPPAPAQKPITYFIVQPEQFQAVCNRLAKLPYDEVAGLIQEFVGTSRAMFDPLPAPAGGKPISPDPNAPGDGKIIKSNGDDSDEPAGITVKGRPGYTPLLEKDSRPYIAQEYDADNDCWWIKDSDAVIDKGEPGGAE
jgi:hypothetical protein